MIKVNVRTFGSANQKAGWNSREIELAVGKSTIEDVLRSARLQGGNTLFDLISKNHELRDDFGIFLSGRLLEHPVHLGKPVENKDELIIVDFPFQLGGG